jgi:hypothetical protein
MVPSNRSASAAHKISRGISWFLNQYREHVKSDQMDKLAGIAAAGLTEGLKVPVEEDLRRSA